jgi:HEAT repeat protein
VSERQRHELLAILEQQGAERIAELASIHLNSPSPTDRALAVELAGMAGTPECVRQTINALQDPAPGVRRRAAAALSGMRSPEAIPALSSALKDPNPKVRIEATRALGMIDDDEVIPALISALKDPEVRVRDQAADVLIRWSSPGVARQLVDALRSADLNRAAGDLLSRMGMTAVEPLVEMLLQGSPELTRTVGELLQKITGPDPFLDELASLDPVRRLRAVEALGAMGGPRAVDGLVRALADPDERIRVRGLQHLGRLGDRRAIDDVRRTFASDPVFEVAEAAEEALQRLEPPD